MSASFRFGRFVVDPSTVQLRREGTRVPLQELPFRLLCALIERPGEVVTREELRLRLWSADVHVDFENSLNVAVSRLREALGDTAVSPRFVATEPRRGFRFIAPVEPVPDPIPTPLASTPTGARRRPGSWLAAFATLATLAGAAAVGLRSVGAPPGRPLQGARALLAVLPFKDLSPDPDQDHLGEGMTEELIGRLGRVSPKHLGVVARSSVMRFTDQPVERVARELGVQYVVEGTVRREAKSVRITVRLVDTADRSVRWSESFDETLSRVLPLQADIAAKVSQALAGELLGPDREPTRARSSSGGHESYLKGRHLLNRRTRASIEKALLAFQAAVAADVDDPAAHRGLAETYLALGSDDVWPPNRAWPKAAEAAREALAREPDAAEALLVLAEARFHQERDWAAAEGVLRRVLDRNPSLARAHAVYARFLSASARHDEALREMEEARRLDPLALILGADLCWTHFLARRYQSAVEQCQATLELDPHFLPAQDNLKWVLTRMGSAGAAADAFLRVVSLEGDPAESVVSLRRLYANQGMAGLHRESLRALLRRAQTRYQSPYDVALEYAALGERAAAVDWLQRSFDVNEPDLALLRVDPRLDPLRGDGRFERLVVLVGAPWVGPASDP